MKTFTTTSDLPRLTEHGFEVINLPRDLWSLIQDFYVLLKPYEIEESVPGFITSQESKIASSLMSLDNAASWKNLIASKLKPLLLSWINQAEELELSSFYGIRSYHKGAILKAHVDRINELHLSGIIIVDYQGKNWPLDIQDHDGKWHKVYAEPGQMILYESAICEHGRVDPFHGEFFRNCYIHYKLKNYEYLA